MNRKIKLFIVLFFLSFLSLNAQMTYYYNGVKTTLNVSRNFLYIIADEGYLKSTSSNRMFKNLNVEIDESKPIQGMAKLKLNSAADISEYSKIVESLKQEKQIRHVLPLFERGEGLSPIGTSDIFYLKLKEEKDIEMLQNVAVKKDVQIINEFMPLWYIMSIKNSEFVNSIEATNYFFETGQFDDVDPAFMFEFKSQNEKNDLESKSMNSGGGPTRGVSTNVSNAWSFTKGAGVKVAVVDDGIQLNHSYLSANIYASSYDASNRTSPQVLYNLASNTGTRVAGIIAANGSLIKGVAPESKIISVSHPFDYFANNQTVSADLAAGITWAVNNGADIISCSWGCCGDAYIFSVLRSVALESAISYALINGRNNKGCVVVFTSGKLSTLNSPARIDYPAYYHNDILVVGAVDANGNRYSNTGYGQQLDISAPGDQIPVITNPNGTSGFFSGSNAAAPHISGIAALLLSVRPDLTGLQVRNAIESKAQKVGGYNYQTVAGRPNGTWFQETGYGLADAFESLKSIFPTISSNTSPAILCSSSNATNPSQTFTASFKQRGVKWNKSSNLNLHTYNADSTSVKASWNGVSSSSDPGWISLTLNGVEFTRYNVPYVGVPKISSITGPSSVIVGNDYQYYANSVSGSPTSYSWFLNNSTSNIYNYGNWAKSYFYNEASYAVSAQAINVCGTGDLAYLYPIWATYYSPSPPYPNPTSDVLNVEVGQSSVEKSQGANFTYDIRIYDGQGNLLRQTSSKGGTIQFNLSNLPDGLYYLHIYDGVSEKPEIKQIEVAH